jgi:hypothetical protein
MTTKKWRAGNKRDLIIEVWEKLDCESVGARELEQIQLELHETFGKGALESPAAIARVVADEGAVLRHPEVFQCDLKWREEKLKGKDFQRALSFSNLQEALESLGRLEVKRGELEAENDKQGLGVLRQVVEDARQDALLTSRGKIIALNQRGEAKEIAEWLAVWLQSPQLFSDWLDLRLRSPEFLKRFDWNVPQ